MSVVFKTFMPELVENMPIIKAGRHRYKWYEEALEELKNEKHPGGYTAKCPGIISVNSTGWIQRAYQDFTIQTNGDTYSFGWQCDLDQSKTLHGDIISNYVDWHGPQQYWRYKQDSYDPNILKSLIKINSPWVVDIPEGYTLLCMPVPYNDDDRFVAACGILRGKSWLNIQLFWKCLNSTETIKAGTPLVQYILVKDNNVDFTMEIATKDDASFFTEMKD
jgi:hypothetical protein